MTNFRKTDEELEKYPNNELVEYTLQLQRILLEQGRTIRQLKQEIKVLEQNVFSPCDKCGYDYVVCDPENNQPNQQ